MEFTKYHIAGKDYIYCADKAAFGNLSEKDILSICDRHKGVGADGIFTFYQNCVKSSVIKGFSQIGECMRDFSSASICTFFEAFLTTNITEHTFLTENGRKITVKTDFFEESPVFFCTLETSTAQGIFAAINRKTEIGNRILTLTPVCLNSAYAIHFTDCRDKLKLSYLGRHFSENSLFRKAGNLILAEKTGVNSFDISFYENGTGCPRPQLSAFGAVALAACKNGISNYGDEIHISCNGNTVSVTCLSPEAVTVKCTCEKIFRGSYFN